MSALLWKEWRENLKWGLLAMVALAGAELYGLYTTPQGEPDYYTYTNGRGITLTKETFLVITTFGPAIIGLFLGFIQILPELKTDRWAALLHRPVSRSRIFWGKVATGVLLYVIATGLPFLLCATLVATPGHFSAPFVPGLTLPGAADTVAGLMYYFAALTIALHRGTIIAKGLPLLAALYVSFFVASAIEFGDALTATLLMTVALCIAAWGAMQHQSLFGARPWLGRLAFFAVAFYGLCEVGDLLYSVINANNNYSDFFDYEMVKDGPPLKLHYVKSMVVSVQNLDGTVPTDPDYKPDRIRNHLRYLNQASSYLGDPHGWKEPNYHPDYRRSYRYVWVTSSFQHPQMEQWFYLRDQHVAVGMQPVAKMRAQILDARGFQPPSAQPVPFPSSTALTTGPRDGYVLWDRQSVRFADLPQRKITSATLPDMGEVRGMANAWAYTGNGGNVQVTAVALTRAMVIYDSKDHRLIATLPYQRDTDRWGRVSVGVNPTVDRFQLWYHPSAWVPNKEQITMPSYIDEMTPQGEVVHSYTVPPLPPRAGTLSKMEYLQRNLRSPAFFFGTMLYQKAGAMLGNARLKSALDAQFGERWLKTREFMIRIPVLSAIFAGLTLLWARRGQFSWRRAVSWAALVLCFNVGGFLAFRLLADWPRLLACGACRSPRRVDEGQCGRCGNGWPESTPNGTEIFDEPVTFPEEPAATA